ncbi:MAG: MATE family efflux transporter [Lachnospiraceae bacterium]|nr:MATE family efflux transporter [Lachnospiraceae bacterium]
MISMLVTGIYNTADTYFVGKISTQATAAVGLVFSVMAIIQALGFFCGHGSGNYLSRQLGSGNIREASEMASTGFAFALILGVTVTALGLIFIRPIAFLIGATETTLRDTIAYMRIILLGAPFMIGQFVINNQLRFQGNAIYAMVGLMCGAVLNIGLDPLLILVLGMGVSGAAIATVSGQLISFLVLLLGTGKSGSITFSVRNVHINRHYLLEIVNGGAPSLFRQGLTSVSTLLLNHTAGSFGGDAAIAGMSIVNRTMMLIASALIGFGQGYQPVCSYNYGAGLFKRVKQGFFFCVKYGVIFLCASSAVAFIFAPEIVEWFRNDPDVVRTGAEALRYQAVSLPLMGVTIICNMMLQSSGKGVKASIAASARSGLFFIPLIIVLPRLFGLKGVMLSQPVADLFAMFLALPLAWSELKKM